MRPEGRAAFVALANDYAVAAVRDEAGTLQVVFVLDEADPGPVYAYVAYRDRAAFEAHAQGQALARALAAFAPLLAGPPVELAAGPAVVNVTP